MDKADERTGIFDKALVAGISCLVLWTWLHYEGGCYSLRSFDMTTANVRWLAHSGVAAMASLTVCSLALRSRRSHPSGLHKGMRFVGSLCALLGTAAALAVTLAGAGEELAVLALASGVLTGIGQGLLLCLFCSLTSHLGTRASLAHIVAALAISATLMVACHFLSDYIGRAIGLICPLICLAASAEAQGSYEIPACNTDSNRTMTCVRESRALDNRSATAKKESEAILDKCLPHERAPESFSGERAAHKRNPRPLDNDHTNRGENPQQPGNENTVLEKSPEPSVFVRLKSPLQLCAICLVLGMSSGFVGTSYELLPESFYQVSCLFVVLGTFMAAVLAYLSHFRLKMGAWSLMFKVTLPLMAVSYLLLPFPAYGFIGPGIHALGYQYFFVLLWPLLGSPWLRHGLPALATIGGGLGAVQAGQAVGSALWICLFAGDGASADPMALTLASGTAMLLALLLAVMFERPAFAWAEMRPGKQADVGSSPNYEQLMGLVGARYDLSPREVEVLALIGRGHTRQNVADALGISLQTAKTHVARIYHKLDVHSQQEMLDVLEACREEYGRGPAAEACGQTIKTCRPSAEARGETRA